MKEKTCRRCGETKPLSKFYKNKNCKDGHGSYCKVCVNKTVKDSKTPEKSRKYNLKSLYGITLEQYDEMLKNQNYGCKICGKTAEENKGNLVVDHCHSTGHIRGLLCHACNKGLGNFKDDTDRMRVAMTYLTCSEEWPSLAKTR